MSGYAEKHGGFEIEMVGDKLLIASKDGRMELGTKALFGMLEYLAAMGVIHGLVQKVGTYSDGGMIFQAKLQLSPGEAIIQEMTVFHGEVEWCGTAEKWGEPSIDDTAEDKGE